MIDPLKIQVEFLGEVTASVAHDLQNILAVIRENSGLMEDYIALNSAGENQAENEMFVSGLSLIAEQVGKGVFTTSMLNSFAHTTEQAKVVEPLEIIENLLHLTDRILKRKGLAVEVGPGNAGISIPIAPVLFQAVIYRVVLYSGQFCPGGLVKVLVGGQVVADIKVFQTIVHGEGAVDKEKAWENLCQLSGVASSKIAIMEKEQGIFVEF